MRDRSRHGAPTARRCATSPRCSSRSTTWPGAPAAGPRRRTAARSSSPGSTWTAGSRARRSASSARIADGLREAGEPSAVDAALLRAFEIDMETREFAYAATYMPSWLWAPTAGIRRLMGRADD